MARKYIVLSLRKESAVALASLELIEGFARSSLSQRWRVGCCKYSESYSCDCEFGEKLSILLIAESGFESVFSNLEMLDAVSLAKEEGNPKAANVAIMGALSNGLDFSEEMWI